MLCDAMVGDLGELDHPLGERTPKSQKGERTAKNDDHRAHLTAEGDLTLLAGVLNLLRRRHLSF